MFTGLIEDVGNIVAVTKSGGSSVVTVGTTLPTEEIRIGDSVAVNGICLTVVRKDSGILAFDVSPETSERSTFGSWRPGDQVNLERALRLSDRLGGHLVTGHVDSVALLEERREISGNTVLGFRLLSPEMGKYLVGKGSVAVDGISLTLNSVTGPVFTLNIIPHTSQRTTLRFRRVGDRVNVETDILGKYVERLLSRGEDAAGSGISLDFLAKNGFM